MLVTIQRPHAPYTVGVQLCHPAPNKSPSIGHLAQLVARTLRMRLREVVGSTPTVSILFSSNEWVTVRLQPSNTLKCYWIYMQRIYYSKRFHACFSYSFAFALRFVGLQNHILA